MIQPGGRFGALGGNQNAYLPNEEVANAKTVDQLYLKEQTPVVSSDVSFDPIQLKETLKGSLFTVFMKFGVTENRVAMGGGPAQVFDFVSKQIAELNIYTYGSVRQLNELIDVLTSDETYIGFVNDFKAIFFFNLGMTPEKYQALLQQVSFQVAFNLGSNNMHLMPDQLVKRMVTTDVVKDTLMDNTWLLPLLLINLSLTQHDLDEIMAAISQTRIGKLKA